MSEHRIQCDCVDHVNAILVPFNTELDLAIGGPRFKPISFLVSTRKKDSGQRGKPRSMIASFCPFCGASLRARATTTHPQETGDV